MKYCQKGLPGLFRHLKWRLIILYVQYLCIISNFKIAIIIYMGKNIRICILVLTWMYVPVAKAQITGIKIVGDTCSNFTISMQALGTSSSPYFFWNFNDPASGTNDTITITGASASPFPTHTFSSAGIYTVCVSLKEPGMPVTTVCRVMYIGLCCNGIIAASDTCFQSNTAFSLITAFPVNSVNWNFGDVSSGSSNNSALSNPVHAFSSPGTYTVTAIASAACGSFTVAYPITIVNCAAPCTGTITVSDTCLLSGTGFVFNSASPATAFAWNFGDPGSGVNNISASSGPTHTFTSAGNYTVTVTVTSSCGTFTVSRQVAVINCPPPQQCSGSISFSNTCLSEETILRVNSAYTVNSVNWLFGDSSSGSFNNSSLLQPAHIFSAAGVFSVRAIVNFNCGMDTLFGNVTITSCDSAFNNCSLYIPNVFTPNGDKLNDAFYTFSECQPSSYELIIFNRWGQEIFKTTEITEPWNGTYKGAGCSDGVYAYLINCRFAGQEVKRFYGHVTLLK